MCILQSKKYFLNILILILNFIGISLFFERQRKSGKLTLFYLNQSIKIQKHLKTIRKYLKRKYYKIQRKFGNNLQKQLNREFYIKRNQ